MKNKQPISKAIRNKLNIILQILNGEQAYVVIRHMQLYIPQLSWSFKQKSKTKKNSQKIIQYLLAAAEPSPLNINGKILRKENPQNSKRWNLIKNKRWNLITNFFWEGLNLFWKEQITLLFNLSYWVEALSSAPYPPSILVFQYIICLAC